VTRLWQAKLAPFVVPTGVFSTLLPQPLGFLPGDRVRAALPGGRFPNQLAVVGQPLRSQLAGPNRSGNGTSWFVAMPAVPETVGSLGRSPTLKDSQLPESGREWCGASGRRSA